MLKRGNTGEPFAFRLFLGVAVTLLAAGFVSYTLISNRVQSELLDTGAQAVHLEVESFESTVSGHGSGRADVRALARRMRIENPTTRVLVVDRDGRRVAGSGEIEYDPDEPLHSSRVVEYPGSPHFRHVTPVRAGRSIYTLVVEREAQGLDHFRVAVRESMYVMAIPSMLVSLLLFWLLAGRTLHARHRFALERATRDGLTDLGNHRAFQDELRHAVSLADRSNTHCALAVFDVDDFKFLNDRRGHQHGDDVLRTVAQILNSGRGQDRAFRTGGDEFALILPMTNEWEAHHAAVRITRLMSDAGIAVSCGLSATRPGMNAPAVLREEADAALYEAKRRRTTAPVKFSEISQHAAIITPEKVHALRLLLNDRAADVAVQPIWDLDTGTLVGMEGLSRFHGDYGLQGPVEAFDIAEQTGRIGELDRLCVSKILERVNQLPAGARMFINVHPASLDDGEAGPDWLLDALAAAHVSPDRVVIEVTERSGARVSAVIRAVKRLRELGLKVALDDVGAGNSGLEMMHSVEVDYIKVDRSIVSRAASDRSARAVLSAIVAFAETSGTFVIAEGIEDAESLGFVRTLEVHATHGIRGGQGYGLGRPAPSVSEAVSRGGVPQPTPMADAPAPATSTPPPPSALRPLEPLPKPPPLPPLPSEPGFVARTTT